MGPGWEHGAPPHPLGSQDASHHCQRRGAKNRCFSGKIWAEEGSVLKQDALSCFQLVPTSSRGSEAAQDCCWRRRGSTDTASGEAELDNLVLEEEAGRKIKIIQRCLEAQLSWTWLPIAGGRLPSSCVHAIWAWSCMCSWALQGKNQLVWGKEKRKQVKG